MSRENKKSLSLGYSDFNIAGNSFRAWHDDNGRLFFVIDETIDEYKPNVLLVMGDVGDRKWDDVLTNDYGIDLEDIRPKKDNKYQKLDIEYDGLDIYAALIDAYRSGADVSNALSDLLDFRDAAVRRAATTRLNVALDVIEQSGETIRRTNVSLANMRDRRRKLRNRLARQKEDVGREPTKQSAAKILRTESHLDDIAEKMARAEARIENANRRIEIATSDADAARELLAHRRPGADSKPNKPRVAPASAKQVNTTETASLPVPEYEIQLQPQDEKMPDSEEVKPLFDKDPEILDEEIAFKPVEFDEIKPQTMVPENSERPVRDWDEESAPAPQNDETPDSRDDVEYDRSDNVAHPLSLSQTDGQEYNSEPVRDASNEPVLDSITTVQESVPSDVDTTGRVDNTQYAQSAGVRPASPVAPAPVTPVQRPISPISGGDSVRPVGPARSKPTVAYYLLLILLIVLSVFTLWLYQKKNGGTLPFLNAKTEQVMPEQDDNNIVGFDQNQQQPIQPVSVVDELPQPEPVPEPEPEPDVPVVLPEPVEQDTPIDVRYPNEDILRAAEPDVSVVESETDVLARKNPYYVSRDDQVVYVPVEPEFVSEPEPVRVTNVTAPSVIYDDDIITVPGPAPEYDEPEYYYEDTAATYQPAYNQNEYNEYSGGFVQNDLYNEQYNEQQYYDASGPETRRYLDVYDGGQYSISYDETTY